MVIKKIISYLFILFLSSAFVISCTSHYQVKKSNDRLYFLNYKLQDDSSKVKLSMDDISKSEIAQLPNLHGLYHSKILIGGYGEHRDIYSGTLEHNSKYTSYHAGYDVLVPYKTKVLMPADGEVISSWWYAPQKETIANGVGGEIFLRFCINSLPIDNDMKQMIFIKHKQKGWVAKVPKLLYYINGKFDPSASGSSIEISTQQEYDAYIQTLSIDMQELVNKGSKYIYAYFMHLSKDSVNLLDSKTTETTYVTNGRIYKQRMAHIDVEHSLKVKAGTTIGYVGDASENGGWSPHVHLETYAFTPDSRVYRPYKNKFIVPKNVSSTEFTNLYRQVKATGTIAQLKGKKTSWDKKGLSIEEYFASHYYEIDSNNIFKFFDRNTRHEVIRI